MAMDFLDQVSCPATLVSWCTSQITRLTCYSVPVGIIAVLALILSIPNGFPHHISAPQVNVEPKRKTLSRHNFQRVDFTGTALLLAASIILVTAFEEAANGHNWNSALVIALLIVSSLLWPSFIFWERRVTLASGITEPIFPWRFLQSRVRVGMIL